jgi:hypothetical protein
MLKLSEFTLEPIFDQKIDHEPFGISKKNFEIFSTLFVPAFSLCPLTPERKNTKIMGNKKAPLWGLVDSMPRYICLGIG